MHSVAIVLLLVVLATVVAASAGRLRLPAPSLLVVAGVAVGLLPGVPDVRVSPDVITFVVLPPLLYAAAEDLSGRDLRAVWRPVTALAFGLVLLSAAAVGLVAAALTPLPGAMAFLLGAVVASTDPVAVTALGRRLPLPGKLQALIQGESLFNDATSLVLVRVAVGAAVAGGAISWQSATGEFLLLGGGGVAVGLVVAGAAALIRRHTEDPVLETVVAVVTPYAAFLAAEAAHLSGVTAVVVAGVLLSGLAPRLTNSAIRLQLHAVYGTIVFVLESVVFSLVGLALPGLVESLRGSDASDLLWEVPVITATLLAVRALWVFPLSAVLHSRTHAAGSWRTAAVVSWAGARGVIPMAAALSIPLTDEAGNGLPERDLVLTLTAAVVVLTLTVQGFTLSPLVRRSGIAVSPEQTRDEDSLARLHLARAALARVGELEDLAAVPQAVTNRLRRALTTRIERGGEAGAEEPAAAGYRPVRRELIAIESAELSRLYETGLIGEATRRRLQRLLDLEDASLSDD